MHEIKSDVNVAWCLPVMHLHTAKMTEGIGGSVCGEDPKLLWSFVRCGSLMQCYVVLK